jgi:CRP/FNR family transcriptional regulator
MDADTSKMSLDDAAVYVAEPDLRLCWGRAKLPAKCASCRARTISFCSHVDGPGMARLRAISSTRLILKGKFLFEQDMPLNLVFIIVDGMVKLYRLIANGKRQVIGFLGPGDLLGSLKRMSGAHCTARAVTDVIVCQFDRSNFFTLLARYPNLTQALLFMATDEIEAQHEHVVALGRGSVRARMATFLLSISHRWDPNGNDGKTADLRMTRADIADYLGVTIETVSRCLSDFKRLGYIDMPMPQQAVLCNMPALYRLAGIDESPARRVSLGL